MGIEALDEPGLRIVQVGSCTVQPRAIAGLPLQKAHARTDRLRSKTDPLQQFLIGLKILAELVEDLPQGHPGCLIAVYCYQERLFDNEVRLLNRQAVLGWRTRFRAIIDRIVDVYPPNEPVDLDELANMVSTVVEGGIVMSKALGRPHMLANQIMLLRSFVKLLFTRQPV